jgi:16S rRNA (cytosine1402-N4)-methyltransferase
MSEKKYTSHYSVLFKECMEYFEELNSKGSFLIVDGTFGGGGHTFGILERFPNAKVLSFDQDPDALDNGYRRIKESPYSERVSLINSNFIFFKNVFKKHKFFQEFNGVIDGALLDLGVSSHHFDCGERGFSFRFDAQLDMRMDTSKDSDTAKDILNSYTEEEIANIIYQYGEERLSRRIAKGIIEARKEKEIETTKELENICFHAYPKHQRHKGAHPATRTFQAIRIAVNEELRVLEDVIPDIFNQLNGDGIFQIISFHSLEDRIVKHSFKKTYLDDKERCKILTKRPLTPSEEELEENPRSRSAKLRVIKRL